MVEIVADKTLDEEAEQQMDNLGVLLGASEFVGFGSQEVAMSGEGLAHLGEGIQFLGHRFLHSLVVAHTNQETTTLNQTTAIGAAKLCWEGLQESLAKTQLMPFVEASMQDERHLRWLLTLC